MRTFVLSCIFAVFFVSTGVAEDRFALVLSNETYEAYAPLEVHNGAKSVASALKDAGFETRWVRETNYERMQREVIGFVRRLSSSDDVAVGFVFYSGYELFDGSKALTQRSWPAAGKYGKNALRVAEIYRILADSKARIIFVTDHNPLIVQGGTSKKLYSSRNRWTSKLRLSDRAPANVSAYDGVALSGKGFAFSLAREIRAPGQTAHEAILAAARTSGGDDESLRALAATRSSQDATFDDICFMSCNASIPSFPVIAKPIPPLKPLPQGPVIAKPLPQKGEQPRTGSSGGVFKKSQDGQAKRSASGEEGMTPRSKDDEGEPPVTETVILPIVAAPAPIEGRIAHHAPRKMLVDQTYFLEVIIDRIEAGESAEEVDAALLESIGSGTGGSEGLAPISTETSDVDISDVMIVRLLGGDNTQIQAATPERQLSRPGQQTRWLWTVTPQTPGQEPLSFSVFQEADYEGEPFEQLVKIMPLSVKIETLDDILKVESPVEVANEVSSAAADASPEPAPSLAAANTCQVLAGADPDRLALIITNLDYTPSVGPLTYTHGDGVNMTAALLEAGFEVTVCQDLDRAETLRQLIAMGQAARDKKEAGAQATTFFYYSGHGVNASGTNYLIPVDLDDVSSEALEIGAVDFEDVLSRVTQTGARQSFVVFDACRNTMADKGLVVEGFRPISWLRTDGLFQAFATAPGQTAADNGIYSEELSSMIRSSTDRAAIVFDNVQASVHRRTAGKQNPHNSDLMAEPFYFKSAMSGP